MTEIPSPYNFIPLAKDVFFPNWSDKVSMDVPFSDGISGTLTVRVTAKTPLYIRSGGFHPARHSLNDPDFTRFFQVTPGGPFAIPGSSLKGMLRGVLEIASFGKIVGGTKAPRVADHRYAVRDLQNAQLYTSHITETINGAYKPKIKAAWLSLDPEGAWSIVVCDLARVEQEELERWRGAGCNLGNRGPAKNKYERIAANTAVMFDCGPEIAHLHSGGKRLIYKKASNLGKGNTNGTIVITGQPSPRNGQPGRKHLEFIFFDAEQRSIPVPDEVKKDFKFAHSDLGENRKPNEEWGFWEQRLKAGGRVPVFVLLEGNKISSMGLAMMYRLPYKYSLHQAISHTSPDHLDASRLDLAELLFGRVEDQDALRGRVSISPLLAENDPTPMTRVLTVLNGPKPTYYPNYVRQQVNADGRVAGYNTFMDENAEISGWKRYIARPDSAALPACPPPPRRNDGSPNLDVATAFCPLGAGSTFKGAIHIHNLRPAELGALLWAITWGGNSQLRHSLGMGKPYGFGSVSIDIVSIDLHNCNPNKVTNIDLPACQQQYIDAMNNFSANWARSEQLRTLLAIANPATAWPQELRYPQLGDGPGANEFVAFKRNRLALQPAVQRKAMPGNCMRSAPPVGKSAPNSPVQRSAVAERPPERPASVAAPVIRPVIEKTPAERLIEEMDRLSSKDVRKKLQTLEPENLPAELRQRIYTRLKKKPGFDNWENKAIIEKWKPQ